MNIDKIKTLGELKKSGYKHRSVKEEVRENLLKKLQKKENSFPGIVGYEDSCDSRYGKGITFPPQYSFSRYYVDRPRQEWPAR